MAHRRIEMGINVPAAGTGTSWEIAATVHLPVDPAPDLPVIVALPGGGYNRHYFDIAEPGYSEAAAHAERGIATIAIDHLGAGDSSIPPPDVTSLETVAAANHAALQSILTRLRDGTLRPGIAPLRPSAVVGIGQSMGGHALVAMQAHHRSFDAVAVLGSSMVCTTMPMRPGEKPIFIPKDATPAEAAVLTIGGTDWPWVFHWEDVPPALVDADVSGGMPIRGTAPAWGSLTTPGFSTTLVLPGVVAAEAAAIDVPVLVAMGERDVCRPPIEELAAFSSASDRALFVAPRMAHMHNFAGTRRLFWNRIENFVDQAVSLRKALGYCIVTKPKF
ncbi:alpha/beta hydrolase [Flavisphingomonas formosensis]|uniref:alpha/beta hydrolase n=1 Tax=Flavisphingomonas formosensis TaxID=861534 RepID=UPI0012FC0806|nr:alpha/beta fold hydrolase [Sphingomonas formosensis]